MLDEPIACEFVPVDPDDWTVLVNKDVREYGFQGLGDDVYGQEVLINVGMSTESILIEAIV